CFFFSSRRRHTRSKRDWSSDVCSSDLRKGLSLAAEKARACGDRRGHQQIMADRFVDALIGRGDGIDPSTLEIGVLVTDRSLLAQIGRASCREGVRGTGCGPWGRVDYTA